MLTGEPRTALESVASRRFLLSSWPWRCLGYLLTTPPLVLAASLPLAVFSAPWIFLLARVTAGTHQQPGNLVLLLLILLGAALIAALGPVTAIPLAQLERQRLRIVDSRPIAPVHRRPPARGPGWRLRTRYSEAATWRELGYACLLAVVAPVLYAAVLAVLLLIGSLIASPFLVRAGQAPVALAFGEVTTVGQAVPYALAGLVLLPAVPYLLALLAGVHGAAARALLQGGSSEQLRVELVEVSRSRARLVDAFEAERRRIERDLHDGAQQRLVSLTLQLGLARLDVPAGSPAATAVADAHQQAKQLMAELRELIHGIHPRVLADLGLRAALGELADQSPIPVTLSSNLPSRLPGHIEAAAYFATAEALTNIARHSGATNANVTAHQHGGVLTLEISDNGHGGASPERGTGLTGLADRVSVINGRMLLSSPPGGPTLLRVELPCILDQLPSG